MTPNLPACFPFQTVVFDLDGTLIDAFEDITRASNFIRTRNGLSKLGVGEVKKHVGHGARYLVEGLLDSKDDCLVSENHAALVDFYAHLEDSTAHAYPGAVELLEWLRAREVRTAVASNKPHPITVNVVKKLGLDRSLDMVQGEGNGIARKPAPDVLLHLAERAGVKPNSILMVGDTDVDIVCARAAGTSVAVVTHGQYGRDYLERFAPDWIADSLDELREILERAGAVRTD